MKNKSNSIRSIVSASALGMVMGMAMTGNASAAFISCDGGISGKVSTKTDCTILGPLNGNQNDSLTLVNNEGFFGIANWLFDGQWNNTDAGFVDTSDLFNFTGDGSAGTFTYAGGAGISDIMLLFKDGAGTNLVGYLVTRLAGDYSTPFTSPPFPLTGQATVKDVGHLSVYYREVQQIPEPGVLLLVGAGLLGLGLARRRKLA
ncbi:MAG TPA: PEP-CTERM sorting domain-containing protein [Thiobacillus sp.]|nr:PEP-CTERM sorting domain-containing protein [Thiobacillus sp.]